VGIFSSDGDYNMSKLCALVVGHTEKRPGAKNINKNISEFDFNDDLARRIKNSCKTTVRLVYRKTLKELPNQVEEVSPTFVNSLHCNSFNKAVSGTEVLYWHNSKEGKNMAEVLQEHLVSFLRLPDRGIKPVKSGSLLLKKVKFPSIISETFFIDNDNDLERALENIDGLAEVFASAIDEISSLF
jgi:N-acetylmuramoyl-L-alanine amidase